MIFAEDGLGPMHTRTRSAVGQVGDVPVTVTGIAKGSGMIHPDMATMLAFIATDAPVAGADLQRALAGAVARTFNRITVDGCTSTNDCVLLLAGGGAGGPVLTQDAPGWDVFTRLVYEVCDALAAAIVADGEGATKQVILTVTGLATEAEAVTVAKAVAVSPWAMQAAVSHPSGRTSRSRSAALSTAKVTIVRSTDSNTYVCSPPDSVRRVQL